MKGLEVYANDLLDGDDEKLMMDKVAKNSRKNSCKVKLACIIVVSFCSFV